jgi:hypothetical protein
MGEGTMWLCSRNVNCLKATTKALLGDCNGHFGAEIIGGDCLRLILRAHNFGTGQNAVSAKTLRWSSGSPPNKRFQGTNKGLNGFSAPGIRRTIEG